MSATYQQAILTIQDPDTFQSVRESIASAFSSPRAAEFLKSVERASLRIRHFEDVLARGLLGASTGAAYNRLQPGDQGQIREFYLASLEHVSLDLRDRFFKLYAYY